MNFLRFAVLVLVCCRTAPHSAEALSSQSSSASTATVHRRAALGWIMGAGAVLFRDPGPAPAAGADTMPDSFDVDQYLKRGYAQNPMGVSGQAGEYTPPLACVELVFYVILSVSTIDAQKLADVISHY